MYAGIDKMEDNEYFSKPVKELYLDVIANPNKWEVANGVMQKCNKSERSDITIWAVNDIHSRKFYTHNKNLESKVKEYNSKLTHYDKELLDRLIKAVRDRKLKIEEKIFF